MKIASILSAVGLSSAATSKEIAIDTYNQLAMDSTLLIEKKVPYGNLCQTINDYKFYDFQPLNKVGHEGTNANQLTLKGSEKQSSDPAQPPQKIPGGVFLYDICESDLHINQEKLDEIEEFKGSNDINSCSELEPGNAYYVSEGKCVYSFDESVFTNKSDGFTLTFTSEQPCAADESKNYQFILDTKCSQDEGDKFVNLGKSDECTAIY